MMKLLATQVALAVKKDLVQEDLGTYTIVFWAEM
jgi:hypothetical protein